MMQRSDNFLLTMNEKNFDKQDDQSSTEEESEMLLISLKRANTETHTLFTGCGDSSARESMSSARESF